MNTKLLLTVLDSLGKGVILINLKTQKITSFNESFLLLWKLRDPDLEELTATELMVLLKRKLLSPNELDQTNWNSSAKVLSLKDQRVFEAQSMTYEAEHEDPKRVMIFSDVTDSHKSEDELRKQFTLLESIMSAIPHSVFWKDKNSRYLGCNQRFAKDAGLSSPSQLIGKSDYDMPWKKEESDFFVACDKKIMGSGQGEYNIEETQKNSQGEDTVVLTSKVPLKDNDGEVYGILGIYANITDFKNAQKRVKEQELMLVNASQLASLGEMSGGIAHEINNPLSIIKMSLKVLNRLVHKEKIDLNAVDDAIKDMNTTVDRIAKIVVGLRNISRSSTEEMDRCTFDEILKDVLSVAKEKLRMNQIDLQEDLPEDLTNMVFEANRVQVSQVLINLLNNAYDAITDGSFKEKWIKLSLRSSDGVLSFSVTDSGHGIPEETREKIFNPFFTTKEIGKGTGIGLSISKSMMEKNGGRLFYDESSERTSFVIQIQMA